jgi:4-amino-4-deoxy-L-arabinose transferase-like glycosyltransferase
MSGQPAGPSKPWPTTFGWQIAIIVLAWMLLCSLDWSNDGLWAPDAARHFANGQFWGDFLQAGRLDARDYALSYYARYPVIKPSAYPPVFYLIEAAFFGVLGPSPFVAKGLVLGFSLMAALYMGAWLGRFVAPLVAWAGALLLFVPETIIWSHAVMLHVPSLAFGIASMFHARRWLDSDPNAPEWRQFWLAFVFGGLAVGTYFQAAVMAVVVVVWILTERRFAHVGGRPTLIAAGSLAAISLVALPFLERWAPAQLSAAIPRLEWLLRTEMWTYYLSRLPVVVTTMLLALGAIGALGGLASARWRRESRMLLVWLVIPYLLLSAASAKEDRYILFLAPPVIGLAVVGIFVIAGGLRRLIARARFEPWSEQRLVGLGLFCVLMALILNPWRIPVPSASGFREVVAFVEEHSPEGPVFYDGPNHGIFAAYLMAGDPDYQRRVVVGSKLLYSYMIMIRWRLEEYVSSPEEVEDLLRRRAGARLILVETGHLSDRVGAQQHLRKAVQGPSFELLKSFSLEGWRMDHVDVYRIKGPLEQPDTVDLPFPILGAGVRYEVEPIKR